MGENGCGGGVVIFLCPCVWTSNARENGQIGIMHMFQFPVIMLCLASCRHQRNSANSLDRDRSRQLPGRSMIQKWVSRQPASLGWEISHACPGIGDAVSRGAGSGLGTVGTRPGPGVLCSCRLTFPRWLSATDGLLDQPYFYILASGHAQWGGGGGGKCRRLGVYFQPGLVLCVVRRVVGAREVAYVRHDST